MLREFLSYVLCPAAAFVVLDFVRRVFLVSPTKPLITSALDSLLRIPQLLRIGPFGLPNDINEALRLVLLTEPTLKSEELLGGVNCTGFLQRYDVARKLGLERSKAVYSPSGYVLALSTLYRRIETRVKMNRFIKRHPSITEIEFSTSPVFVIGFPRTGTTFLHELLGLHPKVRMHYTWEQSSPVPETDMESIEALTQDRKKRYESTSFRIKLMLLLGGDEIQSIHRIGVDEPEECTTPCAVELPWSAPELPFVAYAADEIAALGAGEAFAWYKKYLQLLSWQTLERQEPFTWMLKCPFHLPYLDALHQEFPKSVVVWTHRDPVDCIASACSLYETLLHFTMENNTIDRKALGKAVLRYTKLALEMAFSSIEKLQGSLKVIHVRYSDNVKNSKEVCKDIITQAGMEFSDVFEQRIDSYLKESEKKREKMKKNKAKSDLHVYKLEDYGISKEQVQDEFKDYISKYRLAEDKPTKRY